MKLGALCVLAGTLSLTGCSSNASGTPATPDPQPIQTAKIDPTVAATSGRAATPTSASQPSTPAATSAPLLSTPAATSDAQPQSADPYNTGKNDLASGNYHAAEADFKTAIARGEHGASSYDGLGTAAIGLGDYMAAYHAFKSAVQLAPRNPAYTYKAAYAALYANDYRGSVAYATRYIELRPKDVNGYHLRLLAYGKLLLRPKQVADARTIIKLQPHSANAYSDLGIALGNAGKYHQSEQAFKQAINLQPKDYENYINLALVENLDKKPQLALQELYRARSLAPNPSTTKEINLAIKNLKKHMRG